LGDRQEDRTFKASLGYNNPNQKKKRKKKEMFVSFLSQ
jgi:hypothetical protein